MHGGQFLNVHLEAAVAGNAQHSCVRFRHLYPDCRGQSKTHSAQSPGCDESARQRRSVALRGPHLVLAYVGKNHAILRQAAEEFIEKTYPRRSESALIKFTALRPTYDRSHTDPV